MKLVLLCLISAVVLVAGQRITTIQLDGVQYYVSRMNPYSPELNYFLAYQYCRSIGLQLASFETKEKVDSMTQYLINAGYSNYEFWTSGNHLGTGMYIWMSTGSPFNATFDNFADTDVGSQQLSPVELNSNTSPQRTARDSSSGLEKGCVSLSGNMLQWKTDDCLSVKDFICEQTRCYYYNYGSIPVSSAQGRPIRTTTLSPITMKSTPLPILLSSTYAPKIVAISKESPPLPQPAVHSSAPVEKTDDEKRPEEDDEPNKYTEDEIEKEDEVAGDKNEVDATSDEAMRVDMNDVMPTEGTDEAIEENTTSVEQRIKQISEEIEKISNSQDRDADVGRQSFFSLSDLIKTLRPNDKKIPQIDSDYSNTMRVLGETQSIVNGDARKLKDTPATNRSP